MENYTDITKTGTGGLKGLKGINNQSLNPSMDEIIEADKLRRSATKSSPESVTRQFQAGAVENIGSKLAELNYGESVYDKAQVESQIANPEAFQDYRAEEQPWYAKVGAGIAKGAVLAGTTFLDGTLGLLFGGGTAIAEGRWSGLWDNDFSKAMQSINEVAEKELPNYYSQQEQNEPWYENIFTANFLGDKLIKNMGFTVGAFYSGNVAASALKATKLPQLIGGIMGEKALDAAKTYRATRTAEDLQKYMTLANRASQAPANITSSVGALISAVNEGRVEALNNSKDWFEVNKLKLEDNFKSRLENIENEYNATKGSFVHMGENSLVDPAYLKYQQSMENEKRIYDQALGKLNEDRLKMGNADLLMNLPILTASNLFQFGRLYANGFKTARKANNIVNKGKYAGTSLESAIETGKKAGLAVEDVAKDFAQYGTKATKAGAVWSATKSALSESSEEVLQSLASNVSGNYYADDVNNFYRSKIDPKATEETVSWSKAFAQGINDTVNDGSVWEGAFIGGLTGAMGMPKFRGVRDSEGKLRSPITMEGGAIGEFKDYNEKMVREQSIADYMNNRIQSPEFLNYYKGLVRHNKYQNDMNTSAENNDPFEFKNAEHAQLISDIAMFDNTGKLEDLNVLINSAFDTSDENLKSIVDNTTKLTETGESIGPYIDSKGNPLYSTEEGKQEMIKKITESKDEMVKKINDYVKIKNDIDIKTGQQLNDDQLEELTWIRGQIDNWNERSDKLVDEIKPALSSLVSEFSSQRDFFSSLALKEGSMHTGVTPLYESYTKTQKASADALKSIENLIHLPQRHLAAVLAGNKDIVDGLKEAINNTYSITADQVQDYIEKIDDIVKLNNAAGTYNSKLKEYLENPSKQIEAHTKINNETIVNEKNKKTNDIKQSLSSAQNLSQFRDILDNEDDQVIKESTLKTMEDEGSEMAKNYRETTQYHNEVKKVLNLIDEDPQVKQDALKLINDQFNNSENLQQLGNPNSIYINNENAFDEDSEGDVELSSVRFQNAQYAIQTAMSKVNNDNIFKDRFSPEYKKTVEKIDGAKGDDRDTTGDSGTTTVPPVNSNNIIPTIQSPIGNITKDMVTEENKRINDQALNPQQLDNKQSSQRPYYRPSIPELHIQATKEGDFRQFSDVAAEKEGKDFSEIYNYLKDAGAFEYVNKANLNVGDELKFMIDPEFENKVAGKPWHIQPTIFIVDGKNNQIVGSLDESEYSVSKYEGLEGLQKRIKDEYANRKNTAGKFIATPTTRVSQIMIGKVPYGTEEHSLKDIPNVKTEGEDASIFGIVKNGVLSTNNQIDDSKIIKPMDMSQKEGRMYLLIPNARGMYSPVAVRVKHFNNVEFNLDDINVASTPMAKNIQKVITKLAESMGPEDLSETVKLMNRDLYIGNLHIDWFTSSDGNGIRFTKVERDNNGNEIYEGTTSDGKPKRKEIVKLVYFNDSNIVLRITGDRSSEAGNNVKNIEDITKEITSILQDFNLPIQINLGMLNKTGYNKMIINSNIITSNITDASMKSSWFTTDYFDKDGNLHKAISPTSIAPQPTRKIETPVGGKEKVIPGIKVVSAYSNNEYFVDLKNNSIKDSNGKNVEITDKNKILFDLAWAQDNFGDSTNGSMLVDNKVLLPSGKVIDRNTQKYIEGKEAQNIKDIISGRIKEKENNIANSNKVIGQIYENQKRVYKEQTDSDFYYILEDDDYYYKYSRVHSRLGGNSIESPKLTQEIDKIRTELSKNTDNIKQYDNYLTALENIYKIKLDAYRGKIDIKTRNTIINIVKDARLGTESQKAIDAGTAVDSIIRQYFTIKDVSKIVKSSNMTEAAFIDLITTLNKIRSNMEARGERFFADNIVLFNKYPDGTRVAGEVDILSVDENGNFRIYDVKTSKYSFYDFINKYGQTTNYFENKSSWQKMSQKEYYTLQLSAYKNLFESQYGMPINTLAIIPFVITYEKSNVTKITNEKGIPINYNPAVNVPLTGNIQTVTSSTTSVSTTQKQEGLPIFESSLELQNPVNDLTPEASFEFPDVTTGYYELDGKIHHGYITPITIIDGVNVYMMKIPHITKGFGRINEEARVASNDFYAVFPNGQTVKILSNDSTDTDTSAKEKIINALNANPSRVKEESSKKTLLFDPNIAPITTTTNNESKKETPANILNNKSSLGANITIQKEQAIKNYDDEFEDELTLRKIDETDKTSVWNQEKELKWLEKVLPQLSENDRVKVVKGLIKVGEKGAVAWGQFNKGIITLSDIAAEGTTYHEAFHVVFNLLLDDKERQALYDEARKLYGEKDNLFLEENMAESFREYVMTRQKKGLLNKIKNFFEDLWIKISNWNKLQPHLISYYQSINEGKYANKIEVIPSITDSRIKNNIKYRKDVNNNREVNNLNFNTLDSEILKALKDKKWTEEMWNSVSQIEREQAIKCISF